MHWMIIVLQKRLKAVMLKQKPAQERQNPNDDRFSVFFGDISKHRRYL